MMDYDPETHANQGIPPWVEPMVIITILIANGGVGIYQDYDAESAIEALKKMSASHAEVLRDGKFASIEAATIVPGDVVMVDQGDKIPADLRLLDMKTLAMQIEESMLTGESKVAGKHPEVLSEF